MYVDLLACPRCGGQHFVAQSADGKSLFQVNDAFLPIQDRTLMSEPPHLGINTHEMFCSTCPWQGEVYDLIPAWMSGQI